MSDYEIIKYILNDISEDLDDEEKVHQSYSFLRT